MGYLPYLMIGNFDDKPLDFMFFPLLFFRQVNNLGFPHQLRGKCYPFVSPGPVWGKRITEAGAHQKHVPNKKRSRSWGGASSGSHASSISTIYTYLTYLTTPPWSPRYYRYHVSLPLMFHDVPCFWALREICVTRPEDGG